MRRSCEHCPGTELLRVSHLLTLDKGVGGDETGYLIVLRVARGASAAAVAHRARGDGAKLKSTVGVH